MPHTTFSSPFLMVHVTGLSSFQWFLFCAKPESPEKWERWANLGIAGSLCLSSSYCKSATVFNTTHLHCVSPNTFTTVTFRIFSLPCSLISFLHNYKSLFPLDHSERRKQKIWNENFRKLRRAKDLRESISCPQSVKLLLWKLAPIVLLSLKTMQTYCQLIFNFFGTKDNQCSIFQATIL